MYSRCDDSALSDLAAASSAAIGLSACGMPMAVRAMTSASIASVLAMPGIMSRARFSA